MEEKYTKVKEILNKYNQEHLLFFYNEITNIEKEKLLDNILRIDFDEVNYNFKTEQIIKDNEEVTPIEIIVKQNLSDEEKKHLNDIGSEIIKEGKYAVVTMAGGQGTRLGHTGPKGTYLLHLKNGDKYIFELFIEALKKVYAKHNVYIPWYIMTSEDNNEDSVKFFEEHEYFGYPKDKIKFFKQGVLPITDFYGNLVLEEKDKIYEAADGNGGIFKALDKNNIIQHMNENKIKWIQVTGVDNILVNLADEVYIGLADESKTYNAVKSIEKAYPEEKVGVFCKRNGKPSVIEYVEMTEDMTHLEDENGNLLYADGNIVNHLIHIDLLNKIKEQKLPVHKARKKIKYIDKTGSIVESDEETALKYESFIFDYFNLVDDVVILRVNREEEFAPIKNKVGVDSPDSATELYNRLN